MQAGQIVKGKVLTIDREGVELLGPGDEKVFLHHGRHREEFEINQVVWVGLYLDNNGRIKATTRLSKAVLDHMVPAQTVKRGDEVSGVVYKVADFGMFIVTPENYIGLIHKDEASVPLKIGDKVAGRVSFIRPDGRLNVSLRPLKEVARLTDSEKILQYVRKREGAAMPYTDDSDPESIRRIFNLSKSAFKRALGRLLKDEYVRMDKGWTYLTEKGKGGSVT